MQQQGRRSRSCEGRALRLINKPAPENTQPPEPQGPAPPPGNWEKPTYCPRRASSYFSDQEGRFINHRWDAIADYGELDLFRMCFPEEWVVNIPIPMTNKELSKKIDLQEFYVFLGCIFFMWHTTIEFPTGTCRGGPPSPSTCLGVRFFG